MLAQCSCKLSIHAAGHCVELLVHVCVLHHSVLLMVWHFFFKVEKFSKTVAVIQMLQRQSENLLKEKSDKLRELLHLRPLNV